MRWLLERGAVLNRDGKNWDALHYAVFNGHTELAGELIQRGANVNARAPNGSTPLMMAAREGQDGIVRLLLAKGANAALKNTEGFTAAQLAKQAGHDKRAGLLSGR